MITMWSSLKSHFGCSYKEISEEQFTEALSLAARVPLEGEFIGKQERKVKELSAKRSKQPCMVMGLCQPLTGIIPRTVSGAKTNSIELFRQMLRLRS